MEGNGTLNVSIHNKDCNKEGVLRPGSKGAQKNASNECFDLMRDSTDSTKIKLYNSIHNLKRRVDNMKNTLEVINILRNHDTLNDFQISKLKQFCHSRNGSAQNEASQLLHEGVRNYISFSKCLVSDGARPQSGGPRDIT